MSNLEKKPKLKDPSSSEKNGVLTSENEKIWKK
jgi:hypothetical protein